MKGNQKQAKNRFMLPEVIENVSYDTIMGAISKNTKEVANARISE